MFCRTSRQLLRLKCPLPFGTFLPIKYPLSTVADLVDISPKLPPNLILAEEKALKPKPAPLIPPEDYLFPILNVPEAIRVIPFREGGVASLAPMEKEIFQVPIRKDIVHEVIRYFRAKRRQPHKTKRMSELRGSNKKPRPQKGGGTSQVGHRRNSAWRGGQKAHGPVLRSFEFRLNKKFRAMGMMIVLAAKFREGNLYIFDELKCATHKTKDLYQLLEKHGIAPGTALIVDEELDAKFVRACENIAKIDFIPRKHMNVYVIMKKDKLVMSKDVFASVQARLLAMRSYAGKRRMLQRQKDLLNEAALYMAEHGDAGADKNGLNLVAQSEFSDVDDDDDEDEDENVEVEKKTTGKRFSAK